MMTASDAISDDNAGFTSIDDILDQNSNEGHGMQCYKNWSVKKISSQHILF